MKIKSVQDLVKYAIYHDRANTHSEVNNKIYINVPKNDDYSAVIKAYCQEMGFNEEDIRIVTPGDYLVNSLKMSGFTDVVSVYDLLYFNSEGNLVPNEKEFGYKSAMVIIGIDCIPFELRNYLTERINMQYLCTYDNNMTTNFFWPELLEIMCKFSTYEVSKVDRDKNRVSSAVYNFRNRFRLKNFDLESTLMNTLNNPPYIRINRVDGLEIEGFIDPSVPIITPYIRNMIHINDVVRNYLNMGRINDGYDYMIGDSPREALPVEGDYLVLHHMCNGYVEGHDEIIQLFPNGFRFKVKRVIPNLSSNYVMRVYFDYTNTKGISREYYFDISLQYINRLRNIVESGYEGMMVGNGSNIALAYYGYSISIPHIHSVDYDKAILYCDLNIYTRKEDIYTCILPVNSSLTILYNK